MGQAGQVFHIWKFGDEWEVRDGDNREVIAVFDDDESAVDWCKQVARELDFATARICCWEQFDGELA
ncbi:MAG: hypothetical protein H0W72_15790 [Planctomycetes bacterium]|nr:hypothetical protein [Planctomycetota bacterium]